ncbi:hypothetical protein [Eubacterium oxidoreducens]|uniref:Uncharacterized protein n=1 Tax=Eubacterium oxidoreducens TaxID=1732 RepID=A0A1G6BMQ1_EUBOX|nr:hypothetical protein [Eubacterium oxidoreducens]SDB21883.1 hypothetical protein SAMN02910417_01643 [Eubacterium oxidoreducens]
MKTSIKKCIAIAAACAIGITMFPAGAQAATHVKKVGRVDSGSMAFKEDVTHDGKKDKITIYPSVSDEIINKFLVQVNGKTALTVKNLEESFSIYVRYIKTSKSREFIQLYTTGASDYVEYNCIYRYDNSTGKFKKVVNLQNVFNGILKVTDVTTAKKDKITVAAYAQPQTTAGLNLTLTYKYKKGKMKLVSKTSTSVESAVGDFSVEDGYASYFKQSKYVCSKDLTFKTKAGGSTVAFKATKDSVVKIKKVKYKNKKLYGQFSMNGKKGWILLYTEKMPYYYEEGEGYFYGVLYRMAG